MFALAAATACADDPTAVELRPPGITSASVSAVASNVLAAVVAAELTDADSASVSFRTAGSQGTDSMSASVASIGAHLHIPVLGLLPETSYTLRVVAYGDGGITTGAPLSFTTGELPADLPAFSASGDAPLPGYVVFASGMYGVVIDNTGRVVWYHSFPDGPGLNFMPQLNGRFAARPTTPDPFDAEGWVEVSVLGAHTRTLFCDGGSSPRLHDLIAHADGSYWVLCDEARDMNLTAYGGSAFARVIGTVLQRIGANGQLLFSWSAFDHLSITDLPASERTGTLVNWTHGNSFDIGADGNILLSFRNLNEITKIDGTTGVVMWRLGGLANQLSLVNDAEQFRHQHSVRVTGLNAFIVLDNIGSNSGSRLEQWSVNPVTAEAGVTRSYGSVPAAVTEIGGSVQALPGGRVLVSFGTAGVVHEVDAQGLVRWKLNGTPGYVFRAQRILSLYDPGKGYGR